ncbi:CAP domain-containing protein [Microvirga sp. KLBC 81]|uniref:CAP domain-containing protein n=1 Tax=Microvirga sp. KLBC 81 TaxID=1862707 RepID=UPI001403553C|nr:CAP domain-containing protein [Microvirga sp. KLBC 81]
MRRAIAELVFGTVLVTLVASCATGTSSVPGTDLLDLINQKRAENNCKPVIGNEQLRIAAERHAVDMRDNNAHLIPGPTPDLTGHMGSAYSIPPHSTPPQRITAAGFSYSKWGEIVYWSPQPSSAAENINWWMNSPPHRKIIQDCEFTHAGVGLLYPGGTKWYSVVDFGKNP